MMSKATLRLNHDLAWSRSLITRATRFALVKLANGGMYAVVTVPCVSGLGFNAKIGSTVATLLHIHFTSWHTATTLLSQGALSGGRYFDSPPFMRQTLWCQSTWLGCGRGLRSELWLWYACIIDACTACDVRSDEPLDLPNSKGASTV